MSEDVADAAAGRCWHGVSAFRPAAARGQPDSRLPEPRAASCRGALARAPPHPVPCPRIVIAHVPRRALNRVGGPMRDAAEVCYLGRDRVCAAVETVGHVVEPRGH